MSTILTNLQAQLVSVLQADSFFSTAPGIPVIAEDKGDLVSEITRAVNEIGVSVCVLTPILEADDKDANVFRINVVVSVSENVIVNRSTGGTLKPCADIGVRAIELLHKLLVTATNSQIRFRTMELVDIERGLVYEVRFTTQFIHSL